MQSVNASAHFEMKFHYLIVFTEFSDFKHFGAAFTTGTHFAFSVNNTHSIFLDIKRNPYQHFHFLVIQKKHPVTRCQNYRCFTVRSR